MQPKALAWLFCGFVAVFGAGYVLLLPPFGWGDEVPHYLRALRLSEGRVLPMEHEGKRGTFVAPVVKETLYGASLTALLWKICKLSPEHVTDLVWHDSAPGQAAFLPEYGAPYPPVSSLHHAAAIWLARRLHPAPAAWLYAARLASLGLWVGLSVAALRLAPAMHMTLLAVLLSPTALFLAAALSLDGLLDAVAVFWVAYVLRLAARPARSPSRTEWICVLTIVGVLASVKLVYVPMALLVLLVPAAGSAPWRPWLILYASATAVAVAGILLWLRMVPALSMPMMLYPVPGATYDAGRLLADPAGTVAAIPRTAVAEGYSWLTQLAGPYWGECTPGATLAVVLVSGALLLALLVDGARFHPTPAQRLIALLVFASIFAIVILAALAAWTPMAEDRAIGVHARYFLPALPALAIALVPPVPAQHPRAMRILGTAMIIALAASVLVVQIGFIARYGG